MSIDKTREEILRLIARVNRGQRVGVPGAASGTLVTPPRGPSQLSAAAAREPVLERRQQTLEALRQQRARLEASMAAQGITDRLERVEQRLEQVEGRLDSQPAAAPAGDGLPADSVLGGRLRDGLLIDLLQLVGSNLMTGDFCIADETSEYHLYFEEGEIRHAVGPGRVGEEAVYGAMAIEVGRYYFRETGEIPAERTVHAKTQFLILEALRQIDENSAGQA